MLVAQVLHDVFVHFVAGHPNRTADDNAAQGKQRDFGGAAADVHHHAAAGLQHWKVGADGGRHRFFDEMGFARACVQRRLDDGAFLDLGDPARYAHHHARPGHGHPALLMRFLNQIIQHASGDFVLADDAVAQRTNDHDVFRVLAPHFFGARPDFNRRSGLAVDGDEGRLIDDNAFATHIHQGIRGTQVNANVERKQPEEEIQGTKH